MNYVDESSTKQIIHDALIKYKLARVAKSLIKHPIVPKQYIDIVVNFAKLHKDRSVLEQLWSVGVLYD